MAKKEVEKDFLGEHLQSLPYFRSMQRAVEARFYRGMNFPRPILDVGSGDGHFASVAFDFQIDVGLDPWWGPLLESKQYEKYVLLVQADGAEMPFEPASFGSAVSNSVLEHIPHLNEVIMEVGRVLKPGAPFYFTVPNHRWDESLSVSRRLRGLRLDWLAGRYEKLYDFVARHKHLDSFAVWQQRLEKAGFEVEEHVDFFSPAALGVLEWGHGFGLPSFFTKKLFGRWILAPTKWNLAPTRALVERYTEEPVPLENGVISFYVARRRSGL